MTTRFSSTHREAFGLDGQVSPGRLWHVALAESSEFGKEQVWRQRLPIHEFRAAWLLARYVAAILLLAAT